MIWDTYYVQVQNMFFGICYRDRLMSKHQSTFDKPHRFIKGGVHSWAMKIAVL